MERLILVSANAWRNPSWLDQPDRLFGVRVYVWWTF